ncbi:glycoside hydrolase family 3 N-terminal domain-containing protein [Hydrotalea sp.]|uniref:glycoside hydrolase family 3 C-terminal domain-containing protein n=1 Tax=Hydrotalea sp. TaxID=2881279 RepID=UPI0026207515|nr:glycoside hydrolase family 3 N-terminal domain-containing protein [Hydrotalea sp.]
MKFSTLLPALAVLCSTNTLYAQSGKANDLVARMNLEQKVELVVGMGMRLPGPTAASDKKADTGKHAIAGFQLPPSLPNDASIPEKVPGAAGRTHAIESLGLPSITLSDGPAGVRINPFRNEHPNQTYYATAWPVGTLLASSWDTALVQQVGKAFGLEAKQYGIDVILAPAMNIQRNPLGGRNFEYYSEDPLVSGHIAAAMVKGVQENGVGTSIKHFVANNQETNRSSVNTIVSERALREIYLKGFEIAVKDAKPWTVMSSYNLINGIYASESPDLLTGILRNEWGFKGLVMTDWFGGKDAVAQMKAGNDLLMPGTILQYNAILKAVKDGNLDEKIIDRNTARVVDLILELPVYKKYAYTDKPDLKADAALSRKAAAEGMVLLQNNNNALPLMKTTRKQVALFGNTSYDIIAGGTGSGNVNKAYTISLEQGLLNAGFSIDKNLMEAYTGYIAAEKAKQPKPRFFFELVPRVKEMNLEQPLLRIEAQNTAAAIITIGRNAGEGADRKVENDFTLSDAEKNMIQQVCNAFHAKNKKVIVVLNIGGVIETASWRSMPDAILLVWQPGLEAGNAIADIIGGKINPSGKLAVTFPINYQDEPSAKNFPGKELHPSAHKGFSLMGVPSEVVYEEGIYEGYRYFNSFHVKTAYPFGYGLSYTKFAIRPIRLSTNEMKKSITATVTITNTGKKAGKEVVQVYVSAPKSNINKPSEELKAFAKTKLLQPGDLQTVTFMITPADLASFHTQQAAWIADAGTYTIKVGNSSENILQTATFELPEQVVTEHVSHLLVPQQAIQEMHMQ